VRMLVCGSRTFSNKWLLEHVLDSFRDALTEVIHGDATGADTLGAHWAAYQGIAVRAFPADWASEGKAAGPLRNRRMLAEKPDILVAFTDKPLSESRGTNHMVGIARAAGVETFVVEHVVSPHD
jgi:hypothetical protein